MRKLSYLLTLLVVCASQVAFAQTRTVTGRVVDSTNGAPIAGALVAVQGADTAAMTDTEGRFSLQAEANATLDVSFYGMVSQQIALAGRTDIAVSMEPDSTQLDEVVVVGYGIVKKASLTGSVATVNAAKLENRATPNLSSALTGLAAGVNVRQSSGNPGSDGANIRVRGVGTFSGDYRGPMVIVDGIESDMNSININDVESISVLKDASSAAIYGSRGANGVILVTTKKGRAGTKPTITYSAILSQQQPSTRHKFLYDYAEHMSLHNQAQFATNASASLPYMPEEIDEWRAAKGDPNGMSKYGVPNFLAYPNTDWSKVIFRNNFAQNHNVSISGGNESTTFNLSLGYLKNPGVVEKTGIDRINARINLETKITDFLKIGTNTSMMRQDKEVGNWSSVSTFFYQVLGGVVPIHEGKYGGQTATTDPSTTNNMLKNLNGQDGNERTQRINTTWYAQVKILDGLTFDARYNYQPRQYNIERWTVSTDAYNFRSGLIVSPGATPTDATTYRRNDEEYRNVGNMLLNYVKSFGNHDIAALFGYEYTSYNYKGFDAQMKGLMDMSIHDITTGSDMQSIGGEYERNWAMVSLFGRINYAFKNKYLFEANFRHDGSSRFAPESRWGTFPSFSGAWRVSEEPFFEGAKHIVNDLKIRASWGKLGNVTSGYYDWQATYTSQNNVMGDAVSNGLAIGTIANPLLHWENINSTEIGIDAYFLRSRLGLEVNLYNKLTQGILTRPAIYATMGMAGAPTKNTADMRNRGIEVAVSWNDRAGDFSYGASVNFAYNANKVTNYLGKMEEKWGKDGDGKDVYTSNIGQVASMSGNNIVTEGHAYNEYFIRTVYKGDGSYRNGDGSVNINGGPRDGMIRTPEDMQWVKDMMSAGYTFNGSKSTGGTSWNYGELIMADVNGDGNYGNSYDRRFSGKSDAPKATLGFSANAAWKGIDVNMTWAGSFGMWYYLRERGINSNNFNTSGNILAANSREMFYYYNEKEANDPNNNIYAKYPRMLYNSNGMHVDSDFYLYNASYFKLKYLQVGYTFPARWTSKIHVAKLRVFFSGENLLSFTDYPGMDPEMGSGVNVYPMARVLSGGLNITF